VAIGITSSASDEPTPAALTAASAVAGVSRGDEPTSAAALSLLSLGRGAPWRPTSGDATGSTSVLTAAEAATAAGGPEAVSWVPVGGAPGDVVTEVRGMEKFATMAGASIVIASTMHLRFSSTRAVAALVANSHRAMAEVVARHPRMRSYVTTTPPPGAPPASRYFYVHGALSQAQTDAMVSVVTPTAYDGPRHWERVVFVRCNRPFLREVGPSCYAITLVLAAPQEDPTTGHLIVFAYVPTAAAAPLAYVPPPQPPCCVPTHPAHTVKRAGTTASATACRAPAWRTTSWRRPRATWSPARPRRRTSCGRA